ncbi:short-chain fatty acyl-CoA regulator family protein [Rhodomicrobium lacus]|uniref:short-chain fatty acyl-CoA regulator family protein n=1 Tax=Rhodomicrobium lacus TaxID=2498452 RepID=UPI000F8C9BC8|nr:short-chain fatty acyl-CoA regulator family protein [Rhodomicrobium lacus]
MKKVFVGVKLKRLREERGLTQIAFAEAIGLSPSYLNQLEKNQRPLTVPVLLRINAAFGIDMQLLSDGDEARLVSDLREVFSDPASGESVSLAEIREIAASMPAAGRAILALHRRLRHATERAEAMAHELGLGAAGVATVAPMPFEQVRDFFYRHHNYFAELDEAAERLFADAGLAEGDTIDGIARWLETRHGVRVSFVKQDRAGTSTANRTYHLKERVLHIAARLDQGQRAFQMATQLAFLEMEEPLNRLAKEAAAASPATHALARIGLANYFAGALVMPYGAFLAAAEAARYDIDLLAQRFGVGFETISHRLSTLQRPRSAGVPFFFIRVDRAGNISKRQSATDFHFSRVGGACPLWNVYEAFAQPGRTLTQVAQMPDGRTYLWIARSTSQTVGGFGDPGKTFAIGLGCDIRHASRLVYSKGLDLDDPAAATPIGAGCKVCERPACPQRAFPMIGRPLMVDENRSTVLPYAGAPA